MNGFKEWLSDHLRYLMLGLAALLFFILVLIGVRVWLLSGDAGGGEEIEILSETATEEVSESSDTESQSETVQSELSESEASSETEEDFENDSSAGTQSESKAAVSAGTEGSSDASETENAPLTLVQVEPEAQTESETETAAQTEYEPVYLTMQGACYIRSAPSYDGEILGTYEAGTVVEFLEDVGGWYHVRVDGIDGYMGARFFSQ